MSKYQDFFCVPIAVLPLHSSGTLARGRRPTDQRHYAEPTTSGPQGSIQLYASAKARAESASTSRGVEAA
jgi:hypothetical protein